MGTSLGTSSVNDRSLGENSTQNDPELSPSTLLFEPGVQMYMLILHLLIMQTE